MVRGRGRRRGRAFVTCGAKVSGHGLPRTRHHKPLQAVEYILLGTLVTNIFPQDFFLTVHSGSRSSRFVLYSALCLS